jgi:hypothetical protein
MQEHLTILYFPVFVLFCFPLHLFDGRGRDIVVSSPSLSLTLSCDTV